ncbi:PH domain-containing protein [Enterococcus thailandicus]|uniref:PH domain-containing protein n=1 Tax=Enterococcus thailandicus TaxID=417368 RepID=UPI0022EBA806|nr:PH domain-containing protein [Enterococcus thailandicus]MDA3973209.1 PH domain-containing protein [Enterococcus thailandicus]MDA3975357.1 PH domain-containing protein [Enterococcus thailandicus]MDA3980669.1 PH domain-containing protein [Enterococcus thailandicus]
MDFKDLKTKIKKECNAEIYDNKLLKAISSKIKSSDNIISAFDCCDNDNNLCLVVATKSKMIIATNQFFKSAKISVISLNNITDIKLKKGLFKQQLIVSNIRKDTVFSKISQKTQLNSLISMI